jgi:uncharacterized iron-regulated protein
VRVQVHVKLQFARAVVVLEQLAHAVDGRVLLLRAKGHGRRRGSGAIRV